MGRKPLWTDDDDNLIADSVQRRKQTGGTIGDTLREVATLLGRTYAACQQRWNYIRNFKMDELESPRAESKRKYTMREKVYTFKESQIQPLADRTTEVIRYQFGEYQFVSGE